MSERGSAIAVDEAAISRLAVEESGERRPRSKITTKRLIVSAAEWLLGIKSLDGMYAS